MSTDSDQLAALAARRAVLEAEIAALQRRVAALPACPVVAEALPPPPPPPPPVTPTPRPARRPPPPPQPARDIDEDRWRNRDISLLEGCWVLDSNFETVGTNGVRLPVTDWSMCFDASGNGSHQLRAYENRRRCEGPVRGRFTGSERLSIDFVRNLQCQGGGSVLRREATCVLTPDGRAQCTSIRAMDQLRQTFTLRRRR